MKKLFATLLTVMACSAAHALPVGNPSDASLLCDGLLWEGHCGDPCDPCLSWSDAFSIRVGFYGDYVFNRHLKGDHRIRKQIDHTKLITNAALITANFWDRFDVFTTLGATKLFMEQASLRLETSPSMDLALRWKPIPIFPGAWELAELFGNAAAPL